MINSSQLFRNVPTDVSSVLKTVFLIFKEHWKTLFTLTGIQFVVIMAVALVLGLVTFGLAATYILALVAVLKNQVPDASGSGFGRHLLDYSVGLSGTHRLLEQYAGYNQDYNGDFNMDDDIANIFDAKFIFVVVAIYIMWLFVLSLVVSVFSGAFTHLIADIYAGNEPCVKKSIRHGRDRMWNVYCYSLLIGLIFIAMGMVMVGLPVYTSVVKNPDDPNVGSILLGVFAFLFFVVALSIVTVAAIPSIVVEGKSPVDALKRSWYLCKSFIGFIYCTQFCYHLGVFIVSMLLGKVLNVLPAFLAFIGHMLLNITTASAGPVLIFVVYMSIRIRTEATTQEDLSIEIGNHIAIADAVELQTKKFSDNGGSYNVVNKQEVV